MKIFIGADRRGYTLKESLKGWLTEQVHEVTDAGAEKYDEEDDYPDYAVSIAQAVAQDPDNTRGIALCGSGVGMAVAANKVPGIRATIAHNATLARSARADDNTNVLALGADFINEDTARNIVQTWLATPFSGEERHRRRLEKISRLERPHE